ncbi:hypothetical protein ACWPM1_00905 [Tsuneonella sp. HG249]
MSRRTGWALSALVFSLSVPSISEAQDAVPGLTAEEALAAARKAYGPPDTRASKACPPQQPGAEIVVCAEQEDQSQFRVESSGDLDPEGAGARGGVPRAPDVGHVYPPGMVSVSGCFIPPCPPPMPKIIDLKAIPEAPPGSDADLVARGLAPLGRDDAPTGPSEPPATAVREDDEPLTPPGSA